MGIENSKVKYSGEGEDFDKYLYGLTKVSEKTTWNPGLVVNVGDMDPLITIAVGTEDTAKISREHYTHILRAKHTDGSSNVIYLKKVTKEEAEEYKKIRKPPSPPVLPGFKYHEPRPIKKKGTGAPTIAENLSVSEGESAHSILSAIGDAQDAVENKESKTTVNTSQKNSERSDIVNV